MTTEHPPSVCPSWCVRDQREDGPMFALDPITWHYAAPLVVHTSRGNGTISRAGVHDAADVDVAAALTWAAGVAGPIAAATELTGGMTSTMLRLQSVSGPDVVLRLMTREPWRSHGEGLATREVASSADAGRHPPPGAPVACSRRGRPVLRISRAPDEPAPRAHTSTRLGPSAVRPPRCAFPPRSGGRVDAYWCLVEPLWEPHIDCVRAVAW